LKDLNDQLFDARDEKIIQKSIKDMREKLDTMLRALNVNIDKPSGNSSKVKQIYLFEVLQ
jgi:hypothetical protein